MQIDSRVTDQTQSLQTGVAGSRVGRQRSVTSDPSGGASRASESQPKVDVTPVELGGGTNIPESEAMDLKVTVEKLNQLVRDQQQDVSFSVDEEANATVIKFFKTTTGELIKQFPPEEILAMKARIRNIDGLLVDKEM
jgi:flagellar protein FlaG